MDRTSCLIVSNKPLLIPLPTTIVTTTYHYYLPLLTATINPTTSHHNHHSPTIPQVAMQLFEETGQVVYSVGDIEGATALTCQAR